MHTKAGHYRVSLRTWRVSVGNCIQSVIMSELLVRKRIKDSTRIKRLVVKYYVVYSLIGKSAVASLEHTSLVM